MTGSERRTEILQHMRANREPVSGTKLAAAYQVSRQVIVQDIALLRASGYDIISTNRGYILNQQSCCSRVFKVCHTDEKLEEELTLIVDQGGTVENVMIRHEVYGDLEAELGIRSRRDVKRFIDEIRSGKSSPLKNITSNYHYHRVNADSEETLDLIGETLQSHGFLV